MCGLLLSLVYKFTNNLEKGSRRLDCVSCLLAEFKGKDS
jgi:hypothetical protein